jgi:LytR cell envelope-related transcriptional attenuator
MKATYKFLFALLMLGIVGAGGWYAWQSQSSDDLTRLSAAAGTKVTDDQVQRLIERVSRFMVLPSGENPSVVILRDVASLAEQQSFYRGAKDGDILIVYSSRAIIYDAKENKLVNVGPIVRNDATPPPSPTSSTSEGMASPSPSLPAGQAGGTPVAPENVKVDVRNGTGTAGLAGATASDLKKNSWITIGSVGDAQGSFKATVIVDLSKGKNPGALAELERILGVKAVTEMPKGEATSTADILVIVGK